MQKNLFILLLLITSLNANEYNFDLMDDIFDLNLEQLQQIKVDSASKTSQDLSSTPANIIIITKEQIEQRGYRGLD